MTTACPRAARGRPLSRWTLLATALLSLCFSGCGGAVGGATAKSTTATSTTATQTTTSAPQSTADTNHSQSTSASGTSYGQSADAADERAIATVAERYYAAAAKADGRTACSLDYWYYVEAIPEDYGEFPGPPAIRGKTCSVVLTKLFKLYHAELAAKASGLRVTGARVDRRKGVAVLRFRGVRAPSYISVHRERDTWKIDALLDMTSP